MSFTALCRDCLAIAPPRPPLQNRCVDCGSPRLLVHPERDSLAIAHVDCDAFYAAIEKRDDPSLADVPVIVGGGRRGVVATCCYLARIDGVRSAMPLFKALRLCPGARVIRPDMGKYASVGREIRARMLALTPLVEPLSIDEAFLDLAGTEAVHGGSPAFVLARFARQVEEQVGITVSVGLSYCKFLAKLASDLDKPRGFSVIGRAEARERLAPEPVSRIWGVGAVAQRRLSAADIHTIGDLQHWEHGDAVRRFGAEAQRLIRLANGIDDRAVDPIRHTKSISAETTFDTDRRAPGDLEPTLFRLSERVADRLKAAGLCGSRITVKLKTSDFVLLSRARSGLPPTQLARRIFDAGRELLAAELGGQTFRLIGIGVSDLQPATAADRGDLLDTRAPRDKALEGAVDSLRKRFGHGAIERGITFGKAP